MIHYHWYSVLSLIILCTTSFYCIPILFFFSMVFKGYRRPLVQEDMWDLNKSDSTHDICQRFEEVMNKEVKKAQIVLQKKKQKQTISDCHHGLAKGISQDVLVMVRSLLPIICENAVTNYEFCPNAWKYGSPGGYVIFLYYIFYIFICVFPFSCYFR